MNKLEIIPAIDLMNRSIVRLTRGDLKTAIIYRQLGTPMKVAKKWKREGADIIHIVDLDAAMTRGDNRDIIMDIVQKINVKVQLGGGLRTRTLAKEMLRCGVRRVILGTLAFNKTSDLNNLLNDFGKERIMVALDYLNNLVMIKGWKNTTNYSVNDALDKFLNLGVKMFLLTSISRDGRLIGSDYKLLKTIKEETKAKIYAAGGISSIQDIVQLAKIGIDGVVIGKALYENKFTLKEAIKKTRLMEQ